MNKISIITINLNNFEGLKRTIDSITIQVYRDYEFIVIDGGSTDQSKTLLELQNKNIKYWISENDSGIYAAMNKGIKQATGDYLLFLNSGDYLVDSNTLSYVSTHLDLEFDILLGNIISNGDIIKQKEKYTFLYFFEGFCILHQASFIKRSLFNKIGLYSTEYKIASDWEFFLKALFLFNAKYLYKDINISIMEPNGISAQDQNKQIIELERNSIFEKNFPGFMPDYYFLRSILVSSKKMQSTFLFKVLKKMRLLKY